jgi:hypothetical protein
MEHLKRLIGGLFALALGIIAVVFACALTATGVIFIVRLFIKFIEMGWL